VDLEKESIPNDNDGDKRGASRRMEGVSVVIPVYNEEENVAESYRELSSVMSRLAMPYEIIFVDDGSSDKTIQNLLGVGAGDPQLRIIEFRRNFGQTAAMAAGFQHTRYDIVIALDGDLQNDPAEIPRMIAKLEEGFDLVAGWRKDRKDNYWSRRFPSMLANRLISSFTNVRLHDYGCTLKVMRGDIARGIRLYGEMHRFIPALAYEQGARIVELPVRHRERKFGQSKYGISRTLRVILDLMTVKFLLGFSKRPIHLFGTLGLASGGLGGLMLLNATIQRLLFGVPMGTRPMMVLGVMLVLMGLQFLMFGLLAEVMTRTYYESQNKDIYVIRRIREFGSDEPMRKAAN
jgi:glycosyltransferase involved in cell wall biosynthesis